MKSAAKLEIKALAAVTSAYASGWASGLFDVGGAYAGALLLTIEKGAATAVQVKLTAADRDDDTEYEDWSVDANGNAALVEVAIALSADVNVRIPLELEGNRRWKLYAKATSPDASTKLAAHFVGTTY